MLFRKRFVVGSEFEGKISDFYVRRDFKTIAEVKMIIEFGSFQWNCPALYDRETKVFVDGEQNILKYLDKIGE